MLLTVLRTTPPLTHYVIDLFLFYVCRVYYLSLYKYDTIHMCLIWHGPAENRLISLIYTSRQIEVRHTGSHIFPFCGLGNSETARVLGPGSSSAPAVLQLLRDSVSHNSPTTFYPLSTEFAAL